MSYLSLMGCSALLATVFVAAYSVYNKYLVKPDNECEIRGRIARVCRGGAVEVELEDDFLIEAGQIFTIYKKMKLQEIVSVRRKRKTQMLLTPVGQARVVSAAKGLAACRFRPIDGYSCNPRVGDLAIATGKKPLRAVIANAPTIESSPALMRLKRYGEKQN